MPEFIWPWVFVLAPLPLLLRMLLPPAIRDDAALRIDCIAELRELQPPRRRLWQRPALWLPVLIWLLLLCAAARPQWPERMPALPESGRDLLLAVDISGSMDFPDMQWQNEAVSRLALVQQLFGRFIAQRQGDRVGLILFGSQAYLQAPLTRDRHTVQRWLQEASIGLAGRDTAIGDAIGLALKHLQHSPAERRVLVLITDGANSAGSVHPLTAARLAASAGLTLYTVGIGGHAAGPAGTNPDVDLDEPLLQEIARIGHGQYLRAASLQQLQAVSATLDRLQPVALPGPLQQQGRPLYAWPLALALLLSLLPLRGALRESLGSLAWGRR